MVSIGIDPSINSTGVCILDDRHGSKYYMIGHKPTKSTIEFLDRESFEFIDYGKLDYSVEKEYHTKELLKTESLIRSSICIEDILSENKPDIVVMEGISYGSTTGSSIVDLSGLNFLYRRAILSVVENLVVASPMEIKKFASGNGGVDKETMVKIWCTCENIEYFSKAKVDDLADSYFMALYGMSRLIPDFCVRLKDIQLPKTCKKTRIKTSQCVSEAIEVFNKITV